MATPTIDKVVQGNVVMHDHSAADLGAVLDTRYVNIDGDTMTGDLNVPDEAYGAGWDGSTEVPTKNAVYDKIQTISSMTVGTEATILALTPTSGLTAYGTDTQFFYVADGTNWRRASLKFYTDSANPDMGYEQNAAKDGYYATLITDKGLYNVYIGTNPSTTEGGIWVDNTESPKLLKIYLNGAVNTILYDLTMSTGELLHAPFLSAQYIRIRSGDSVDLDLDGNPAIQEYETDMGAFSSDQDIDGGSF